MDFDLQGQRELIELQDRLARERIAEEDRLARERIAKEDESIRGRIELQDRLQRERLHLAENGCLPPQEATPLRARLEAAGFVLHATCPNERPPAHLLGELHLHARVPEGDACPACKKPLCVFLEAVIGGEWTSSHQPVEWNELGLVCEGCGSIEAVNPERSDAGVFAPYFLVEDDEAPESIDTKKPGLFDFLGSFEKNDDSGADARARMLDSTLGRYEQLLHRRLMTLRQQRAALHGQHPSLGPKKAEEGSHATKPIRLV